MSENVKNQFFYHKLSYKDKMKRTLVLAPFAVVAIILAVMSDCAVAAKGVYIAVLVCIWVGQFMYTRTKSKE